MSELKRVVNCWTIHTSDDPDHPHQAQIGRPQDWGDPKWMYRVYTLEAQGYRNEVHCWLDRRVHEAEYLALFAGVICTITLPGSNPKLSGKAYLAADDFWSAEWGEVPPYYDADEDEENDAERVSVQGVKRRQRQYVVTLRGTLLRQKCGKGIIS